ncbi:MAG: phospho-sugar mutase, partial [Rikenellaceae bacterium]
HGTGVKIVPQSLHNYGFKNILLVKEQCVNDGDFPTVAHPNPEDPAALRMAIELAEREGAELILATDPDADRIAVGIRDNEGKIFLVNGNQTCVLFTYYILKRWSELGKLKGNEYVIKTVVTTAMMKAISDSFHVKSYNVLTGFKYIAEVIAANEGRSTYICGGEESFGFLIGDFVRDKDAVTACSVFAEMAAWCKMNGTSVYNMLMDLYLEFGLYHDGLRNVVRKGITGAQEISDMMKNYRANPPQEIAGLNVVEIFDYLTSVHTNLVSGEKIAITIEKSNVLQFVLEDGSMVSVRPSGTEPKIKYYYGIKEPLCCREKYAEVRAVAQAKIYAIEKSLGLV